MSQLWSQLHDLFDTDDGSLPDIELNSLTAEEIENIYAYLRLNSKIVSRGSYFWSITTQEEVPVDSVENAANLVVRGEAEYFHIVVGGLTFGGIVIPDLGIFVFENSMSLDYRMGQEWGSSEVDALFALFSKIREIAPLVEIEYPNYSSEVCERFKSALVKYWSAGMN
jgi:hypothetical protein